MSLATLFITPSTEEEFGLWSFSHAAHHRDICRRVFETRGTRLDEYVLDPFDPADVGNWAATHQVMHQQFCQALGLDGFDLSEVDWSDEARVTEWITANGNEHYRAGALLGLG